MAGLRRVFGDKAGPNALGILVPPGQRTTIVVRPRSLPWDLLTIEPAEDVIRFREFTAEEAGAAAEAFGRALDAWTAGGEGDCRAIRAPGSPGFCVRAEVGAFHLIACPREPGQPYRPRVWATVEEATHAAVALRDLLHPPAGARQEIYFNTRHFARS